MGHVRIAVVTKISIRGQTSLKNLRKGIRFFLPNSKIAHKKSTSSSAHNDSLKSDVAVQVMSSAVSSVHPPGTRCQDGDDTIQTTTSLFKHHCAQSLQHSF